MLTQHKIIIIAGLSGVGKTYLMKRLEEQSDMFVRFSAGSLIKKRRLTMDRDQLRCLSSNEILQNQYALIEQLNQELQHVTENKLILVDAHMIIDSESQVIEIPLDIFKKINPSQIIFLHDDPSIILTRRKQDNCRKRPLRSIKQITEQQDKSLKMAKDYARCLSIPFKAITSIDAMSLGDLLLS